MSAPSSLRGTADGGRWPPGYRRLRIGPARVVAHEAAAGWVSEALASGATLHAWAAAQPDYATFAGRGEVRAVPAPAPGPDRRERWAVRHYRRGGAMAGHLDDRYLRLGRYRPFRELTASVAVRERGVPTPAVMAGAAYLDGIYYRADLVTEVVPTARTLADTLHATDGTRGWLEAMGAAGSLIERLGSSGVYHVDLNAHNIVFEEADLGRPWVLDLDRVKLSSRSSPGAEERMRARLTRSIVKVGTPTGERLGDREVLDALRRRASGS